MKYGLIFLLTLLLLAMLTLMTTANSTTSENVLHLIIKGPVSVLLIFSNGTLKNINQSATIYFTGCVKIYSFISPSTPYNILLVNGTPYCYSYSTTISTSETIYFSVALFYQKLTVNIIGNGYVALYIRNFSILLKTGNPANSTTVLTVTHNTTFCLYPSGYGVTVESSKSFTVNNDYIPTKFYEIVLLRNATLNINFNVPNISSPPPGYDKDSYY